MLAITRSVYFAYVLLFVAASADTAPSCLATCLAQTSDPCSTSSLPALITCLNSICPTSAQGVAAAAIHLSYTPKSQYSCQNSVIPGDGGQPSSPLQLSGNGSCVASPFAFKSFVATNASSGMNSDVCQMWVYAGSDCEGDGTKVSMLDGEAEGCQFVGGNSAKLVCNDMQLMTQIARTKLASICSNSTADPSGPATPLPAYTSPTTETSTPTVVPHSSASSSNVTIHSTQSAITRPTASSSTGMLNATATLAPIKALAVSENHANARVAALVAVAAILAIL